MRQPKKHLFFINGPIATPEQEDEADKLGGFVCFRNATMISPDEACEDFDELHGDIPPNYARAAAIKARGEAIEAGPLAEQIGGETVVDNGDGTKTTTTVWRPNAGASG